MTVKPSPGFHLQTTDRHRQSSRQCCWSWILFHCRLDLWWIEPIKCALLAWDSSVFLVACNSHDTVYTAKTDDADFDERERIIEMNWKTTWSVSLKNIGAGRTYNNILLACLYCVLRDQYSCVYNANAMNVRGYIFRNNYNANTRPRTRRWYGRAAIHAPAYLQTNLIKTVFQNHSPTTILSATQGVCLRDGTVQDCSLISMQ